ncbi:hypothetical protein JRQ81_018949 [Phrynocephalus forsythii]|uniref:FAST kinase leucine-rich domain-containing protein n=1 Tax=Phrynocephalus forsythii TaxID=171643 RepID=A0A9Q0XRX4_9SAUR|nr:hypothetical protein JRQ81_018949 [Phrynocephalus forsythii]
MAAVLRRGYHLYRTSFPLCVQASTAVVGGGGGGKVGHAGVLSRPLLALFSTCNYSVQRGRLCAQEETKRSPHESHKVEDFIDTCSTVQELLHLVELHSINGNQAARIITQLSHMVAQKKEEPNGFLEDARFKFLLNTVAKQVTTIMSGNLVAVIKSLYLLGVDQKTAAFRSVEAEVAWRLRRLPCWSLASLVDVVASDAPKEAQPKLLSEVLRNLELRWREIEDTRSVVLLLTKAALLSPTLMLRLEDKALEMAEQFTLEDVRKVAVALAHQSNRSVPLLRAISYYLVQKQIEIPPNVLLDLVFAYGKLNFHQTQLFQKFAMDLQPCIPELVPDDVTQCIKSFAYLRWLNLPLFEAFGQYVVDNEDRLSPTHLSNIILSFAHLNFQPSNREAFYDVIHRGLDEQLEHLDPYLKVDLVWSLCVLQEASTDYLQEVLMPSFHIQFLGRST